MLCVDENVGHLCYLGTDQFGYNFAHDAMSSSGNVKLVSISEAFCYSYNMTDELFDVVNRQDEVIGTTNKVTAHKNGDLHRVGAVYVFDQQGRLYVQVHKKSGGLYDHSVGGHISKGETYPNGTAREAQEELGIFQPLEELAVFYSDEGPNLQHMFGLYTCVAEPSWKFIPNDEVDEIIPMSITEIRELMEREPKRFTRGFINTMSEYVRLKSL